ncbi:MAG TPA: hypothetical protein PLD95_04545 [bacterium]|jgi:hypothetical protein|nr:hypothetical protein [bacterium]HOG38704.1 hypothetical protein [bacterium]HQI03557.1 hypothetical protein [bacterium]
MKNYKELFSQLKQEQTDLALFTTIMSKIDKEKRRLVIIRIVLFSSGLLGSIVAFIHVFNVLYANLAQSGFMSFISLLFSDSKVVLSNFSSFVLVLFENLPVTWIILSLFAIWIFLDLLRHLLRNIAFIYKYNN